MKASIRKYLYDIARAAGDALEFMQDVTFAQYTKRKLLRAAIERQLIVVGEAMVQLKREAPELTATLTADIGSIIAFRNRLVHGYDTVDDAVVYTIVLRDLPALRQEVLALLESPQ